MSASRSSNGLWMGRRVFGSTLSAAMAGLSGASKGWAATAAFKATPVRCPALEHEIRHVAARIADQKLANLFSRCLPNTLETAVVQGELDGRPDTFVLTGDIPAMWLRDSACQLHPYVAFAKGDKGLTRLFHGLFNRYIRSIAIDPYANAFWRDPADTRRLDWAVHDETEMRPGVAERKWELDSLAFPIWIAHAYWRATGDGTPFDARWWEAMARIVAVFSEQRRLMGKGPYRFRRLSLQPSESQFGEGYGNPTRPVGLIHAGFRPSDDACQYPFNIPGNLFAAHALRLMAEMARALGGPTALVEDAERLAASVQRAAEDHGQIRDRDGAVFWAYEVDGYGNTLFMDDANLPSLLSLPWLGIRTARDPVYVQTRKRVWSDANPWFFTGRFGSGIGGPHEGARMIWPLSLITLAMTSRDDLEIASCLRELRDTDAGTGLLHESFDVDDPAKFTRPWFAWVNGMFGELILDLARHRPDLLRRPLPARYVGALSLSRP